MNGTELAFMGISLTGSSGFLFGTVYPNCTLASCSLGYTLASGSKSCVDLTAPIISISGGATTSDNTKSPTYTLTNIEDGVGLNYNYIELKNSAGTVLATLNDPTTLLSKSYQFTGLTLTEADTYSINAYSMDLSLNKSNTATLSFNYVAPKKLAFQVYSPSSQIYSGSSTNYTTNELIYSVSLTNTIAPLFTMNSINSTPITTNSSLAAISQMKPVFSHNGYLFFVAYDTRGAFTSSYGADYQIFQTDGTATGSARVSINLNFNINSTFANGAYVLSLSSFTSKNFIVYNNKPYFVNLNDAAKNYLFSLTPATVSGKSIYSANGVWDLQNSATNLQFAQITPGFFDKQIVEYNGKLYSSFSCELGAYDGATFVILKDLFTGNDAISTTRANCGSPQNFLKYNGKLYFSAQNSSNWGLMSTDGTSAGTTMVKSMGTVHSGQLVGSSSHANNLVVHNNYLYFVGGSSSSTSAVYKSDGTTAGTNIVTTFGTTGSNMTIQYLSTCNNKLYYYFYNSVLATYTIGILDSATGIGVNGGATSLSNGSYITGTGDFACYNNEFYYLDSVSKTIRKSDGVGGFSTAITLNTNSTVNMAAYNGYLYYGDLTNTTDARRTLYIYNGATTIPSVGVLAPTYFVEY
jgi:ELWxxDGT repeat protein